MTAEPICSYYGCGEPLAPNQPADDGHSFRFCVDHDAEFTAIVRGENAARGLLRFWVKAQGGAVRAAKRAMGGIP